MTVVIDVVLPIFGLIGAGAFASWRRWFDATVTTSLNLYVVWFALPALLFRDAAHMSLADIDHPGFVAATAGGMAATFALSFLFDRGEGRGLADRTLDAFPRRLRPHQTSRARQLGPSGSVRNRVLRSGANPPTHRRGATLRGIAPFRFASKA